MKKDEKSPQSETSDLKVDLQHPKPDHDLDIDEDLAEALNQAGATSTVADVNVDQALSELDPHFKEELSKIQANDFEGVVISVENQSEEVSEQDNAPNMFKVYWSNTNSEKKLRYKIALAVMAMAIPLSLLIYNGYLLPKFEFPYTLSMNELTDTIYSYDENDIEVPLFDDFRGKAFTYPLPKTTINLKGEPGSPSFGEFEFFLNLREKDLMKTVKERESELIDVIQRTLELVTWSELQTPVGKEKVKKVVRHRLNEYFDGNYVLGVYYRSIILQK